MRMRLAARLARLAAVLAVAGCAAPLMRPARLTEPVTATAGGASPVTATVVAIAVSSDVIDTGWTEDSGLVVSLQIANAGPTTYVLDPVHVVLLMQLDATKPDRTLSLEPEWMGTGTPPKRVPTIENWDYPPLPIPPGGKQTVWIVFRGYRFDGASAPRKLDLLIPAPDGGSMHLVLADPARGDLRWELGKAATPVGAGIVSVSLAAPALSATGTAATVAWMSCWRRLRIDYGFSSVLLVERGGVLTSATSSFTGSGLFAHLEWPALVGGPESSRWAVGAYAGPTLYAIVPLPASALDGTRKTLLYGVVSGEAGVGFTRFAPPFVPTPFPLTVGPRARLEALAPRWSVRIGVTTWWVDSIFSTGLVSSFVVSF
jgi:hypothetical protein